MTHGPRLQRHRTWTFAKSGGKDQAIQLAKKFDGLLKQHLKRFDFLCYQQDKEERDLFLKEHGVKNKRSNKVNRDALEEVIYEGKSPVVEPELTKGIDPRL